MIKPRGWCLRPYLSCALNLWAGLMLGMVCVWTAFIWEWGILLPTVISCSLLLWLSSAYQFLFFLSGIHLFVFLLHSSLCHSDLPFIMLPYLTMWSDTCPLLSALVYFHPLCLSTSLGFSLFIPLSCPVSPFFFLRPASLHSVTLPELLTHMHAHTNSHSHMHRVTHGHFLAEISWPIWALWHCP